MKRILIILVAFVLVVTGCSSKSEKKKFILAAMPAEGQNTLDSKHQLLIQELQAALGDNYVVEGTLAENYAAVSSAVVTGTAQAGWDSPNTYATSHIADPDVVPLVSYAVNGDRTKAFYTAYIAVLKEHEADFAGKTTEEEKLAVLKGKSMSFVDPKSTSGFLVPSTTFYKYFGPDGTKEISLRADLTTPGKFFSEVVFAGDHPLSVESLVSKKTYASAFCCDYGSAAMDQMVVLAKAEVFNGAFYVSKKYVTDEEIQKITEHFVNLTPQNSVAGFFDASTGFFFDKTKPAAATDTRFFKTTVEDYNIFYEMNKVK
mgnify:CR=1 FL=1